MAFYDGVFVGYLAVKPDKINKEIFMSKIYILKEYRKRGIAKELFNMLKNTYSKNYKSIYLSVNKKNFDSIEVYKKIGFIIIDNVITDIGSGFVMDDYKMKMDF
jgi:ribosomal protein S18 acetylase RimI-like enzyme